jgi:DNA-binding XRE family transcriptional regulator
MSRTASIAAVNWPAQHKFDAMYLDLQANALELFQELDPRDERSLQFLVGSLVKLGVEQREMADLVGVSRTTVGRWANGQNIPRAPGWREWAIGELCKMLAQRTHAGV